MTKGAMTRRLGAVLLLTTAVAPVGQAQQQAAAPAPERTVSQYGDWSVLCLHAAGQARRCEVTITLQDRERQLGAVIAFGRLSKDAPMRVVVQVPPNTRVATPLRMVLEANEVTSIPYSLCNRAGCFAELDMPDELLVRRLRARTADAPGRVEWKDANGNDLALPLPARGYAAAMDALAREPN